MCYFEGLKARYRKIDKRHALVAYKVFGVEYEERPTRGLAGQPILYYHSLYCDKARRRRVGATYRTPSLRNGAGFYCFQTVTAARSYLSDNRTSWDGEDVCEVRIWGRVACYDNKRIFPEMRGARATHMRIVGPVQRIVENKKGERSHARA